jgi:uncharacterized protein YcbK (DUF882 family)
MNTAYKYVLSLSFVLILISCFSAYAAEKQPFFLIGDGKLHIQNTHNGKVADVIYLQNGQFDMAAISKIDQVFGYPAGSLNEHVSYRTIAMLDYFSDKFAAGKLIKLTSGYRSPKYNKNLRSQGKTVAKTSTHIDGMALDFYLDGVDGKMMWETIRHMDCCGAGHYGGRTIHLDSGRPRFWQSGTSKVRTNASDFNRYIYLSTEYDRYAKESKMRLFFTSISDFGFGMKQKLKVLKIVSEKKIDGDKIEEEKTKVVGNLELQPNQNESDEKTPKCMMVTKRKDARFLAAKLIKKLKPGRYRVQINFCNKVAKEMPDQAVSNVIEVY